MKLRLLHVHLPDGTVSQAMPIGQVLGMLERGEITRDTQVCEQGSQHWSPLHYEDAVMRPMTPPPEPAPRYQAAAQDDEPDLGTRLNQAALIFVGLGLVGGILAASAFGGSYFLAGLSGPLGVAIVTAVLAHVMRGRRA